MFGFQIIIARLIYKKLNFFLRVKAEKLNFVHILFNNVLFFSHSIPLKISFAWFSIFVFTHAQERHVLSVVDRKDVKGT